MILGVDQLSLDTCSLPVPRENGLGHGLNHIFVFNGLIAWEMAVLRAEQLHLEWLDLELLPLFFVKSSKCQPAPAPTSDSLDCRLYR